jgi:drug/metabolite transporter (DMT)-like permease
VPGFLSNGTDNITWINRCLGYNIFFFKGLKLIPASRAAWIIATNPIVISLLSALLFKEKLRRIQIIGIIISVVGAIIAIMHVNLARGSMIAPRITGLLSPSPDTPEG